jgi:hypothetical protein
MNGVSWKKGDNVSRLANGSLRVVMKDADLYGLRESDLDVEKTRLRTHRSIGI